MAVAHTRGCGGEDDDRELDATERAVWIELRLSCPDRHEREDLIVQGQAVAASPGQPACRRAAALLIRTGGWLLYAAGSAGDEERHRMEMCAERCGRSATRLERIALEAAEA